MIFNPAEWQAGVGAVWFANGLSMGAFVNYTSGVTNTFRDTGRKQIASFTTVDMTARYEMAQRQDLLSGLAFALTVENLFDRDPPLYTVPYPLLRALRLRPTIPPIGRFISVSLSKHW